ncbi:MAG TPA: polysaccharide deacetylase family protein, partial [Blastocatellia bacterium]|nr:polysaccharide deacetylase family protein [Blastocatellia bacterium]
MTLNLFLTFDVESNRPGNYITCDHVPGAPGLFWIMDELERHGARGVFFVNVYEHTRYPDGWMQGILRQIAERGHEVGLHCHFNPHLDFYRRSLTSYDLEGQTKIIRYGVEFIEAATGLQPISFRSGALRVNDDTFAALDSCGIRVDSSLTYFQNRHNNNDVSRYLSINRRAQYVKINEFPITVITRDGSQSRLDPNSTPDIQGLMAAVKQMVVASCKHAVFIAHSFSFVLFTDKAAAALPGSSIFSKNRKSAKYVKGQDSQMKSVFVDFLRFLESQSPCVRSALFREMAVSDHGATVAGVDFVPRVPSNGLRAWPSAEKYAKHHRSANTMPQLNYRTVPKRVVLHVGTWKTGSKALQKFWALNKEELERLGIFYPLDVKARYMKGGNRSYQSLIATTGDTTRRARLQTLAEEISGSYCETALVSHENICNLPHAELLEFVACLSGCTFKVVLYLRRQDHYAASLYNQHVKAGVAFPGSFDEHFHRYRGRYDYQEMLERLGTVFGATNIVVRPYEKEQFFGGSIFADFMHHGFEWESLGELRIPERDQNSRLDRDALEFKRLINGLDAPKEQKLEIGRHLVKYCASVDPRNGEAFQVHALLSPQQRIKLLQTFVDSNTWVARTYLHRSDGKLFLEPWPGANDPWTPYSGLTTAKAAELTYHIYRSMERDAREREAKIAKGSRWTGITQLKSWPGQRWSLGVGRAIKWLGRHQLRQGRGLA